MIVCKNCGNSAASKDGFCLSCGALLEWAGEEVAVARQPTAEPGRPRPVPLVMEPEYSGLFCSHCGVRNPEGRVYCRTCGTPLQAAPVVAPPKVSWWRRLFRRKDFTAGDRPRGFRRNPTAPGKSLRGKRFRIPAVSRFAPLLIVAGLVGIGFGPARTWITGHVFGLEQTAQAKLSEHFVSVAPVSAVASSAAKGHAAGLAIDGVRNTYWATATNGTGSHLTIRFGKAVTVNRIGLLAGEPGGGFRADARPHTLEVSAPGGKPVDLTFDDSADFQNKEADLVNVTELIVVVKDVYPGQQGSAVAVSEIQFFNRT